MVWIRLCTEQSRVDILEPMKSKDALDTEMPDYSCDDICDGDIDDGLNTVAQLNTCNMHLESESCLEYHEEKVSKRSWY